MVQGEIEALFDEISQAREAAQRDQAMQLDRLAAALPIARAAGLSMETIAQLSGVSRPTLNRLREPERLHTSDAELGVMAALAVGGPQTPEQAVGHARTLGLGKEGEAEVAMQLLTDNGLVTTGMLAGHEKLDPYLILTADGEEALKARIKHAGVGPEFRWSVYFAVRGEAVDALAHVAQAKIGTGEVALISPGVAGNEDFEIAFGTRATSREEAIETGLRQFDAICRDAGVRPDEVAIRVSALGP